MSDDIAELEDWASIFTEPEKLVGTVTKNYLLHKKKITSKMHSLKANYYSRQYFGAGENAAELLQDLVGTV